MTTQAGGAKERVKDWLLAEFETTEAETQGAWAYRAAVGGMVVQAHAHHRIGRIDVYADMHLGEDHQAQFEALAEDEREAFLNAVREWALRDPCEILVHDEGSPLRARIGRVLYEDDLTRQEFMDAVRRVHDMTRAFALVARRYLRPTHGVTV